MLKKSKHYKVLYIYIYQLFNLIFSLRFGETKTTFFRKSEKIQEKRCTFALIFFFLPYASQVTPK